MSEHPALRGIHVRLLGKMVAPEAALDELVSVLHSTTEPDPELIMDVGCGVLESLLFTHEEELWPTLERLAREDVRFRRALAAVWAYGSPAYERRHALLQELGEFWTVTVEFVVELDDFAQPPAVGHRAVHIDGEVPGGQLPRVLRSIAQWLEVVHRVKPVDKATLLALDASSMQRRRKRGLWPAWVHDHIANDASHLISPIRVDVDEPGEPAETDELRCLVAVVMEDGVRRSTTTNVLRSVFDALPDTLSEAQQQESHAEMVRLESLTPWITGRMPSRFGRH